MIVDDNIDFTTGYVFGEDLDYVAGMTLKEFLARHEVDRAIGRFRRPRIELWREAREAYALGKGTLDEVLKYVVVDEEGYDESYKHGVSWG